MDLFAALFLASISFLIGIIVTLIVQYYILYSYFKTSPIVKPPERQNSIDYSLPEALKEQLNGDDLNDKTKSNLPISLVLQFLFHELRHSETIKRWLYKKLSLEFEELLTKTTIGKFFETITIKDMNLGSQFPDIKDITIDELKLDHKQGHIDQLSLRLNLDYTGSFLLSVDAKMKFGKNAYLSILAKRVSGLARLQFTRHPYTHWSFAFCAEPLLDLAVESHFQGRQLQSNITNLIVNQIKKAIKRKHTLPNYKIRYKPFFAKTDPSQLDEDTEIVPQGVLDLTCAEVTRLDCAAHLHAVYCTAAVDAIPWICLQLGHTDKTPDDRPTMVLEVTIAKRRQTQLGVIFRQEAGCVVVETVAAHGCAHRSGVRLGDVVLAVENKPVQTVPQVAKLMRANTANVTLRVERLAEGYVLKPRMDPGSDADEPEAEEARPRSRTPEKGNVGDKARNLRSEPCTENMSKLAQTIGSFSLRKRKSSVAAEGGRTPGSAPATPQHRPAPPAALSSAKKHSIAELPEIVRTSEGADGEVGVVRGREMPPSSVIVFNEEFQFRLKASDRYLNVNVWGVAPGERDELLGYTNVPLSHILNECEGSVLGHYMRGYSFLPPNLSLNSSQPHPLTSHSGFEHVFCYGDVLLSFVWTHEDDIELKRKLSVSVCDSEPKSGESVIVNGAAPGGKHDFIRTQFHRTTHCDFCTKKIWLKDAVQCRDCGLCCHKKCIAKCQMSTGCVPGERKSEEVCQPEITMTEVGDEAQPGECNFEGGMKRGNSVNNLAIPGLSMGSVSKSLPPSPQRTPSRKQSIANLNPFGLCPWALEEVQKQPDEAAESVNRLLDQVLLSPPDEALMDQAKDTGRQFYSHMTQEERVEKINAMMVELRKTLDLVTMQHLDLTKLLSGEESATEKTKLAFLMGQADAKVHGLTVLMLHYCSSLQHTQEKFI